MTNGLLEQATGELGNAVGNKVTNTASQVFAVVLGNPVWLVIGIALIVVTILLLMFLKKIIINSILGLIIWGLLKFGLGIGLPTIPSLVVSVIFGPAGIGVMLLLKFMGLF